jgi:uncharacterized membrane protein
MKKWLIPIVAYLVVCMIVVFLPASEGYDVLAWKLFVGQFYAIPIMIITALLTYYFSKSDTVADS